MSQLTETEARTIALLRMHFNCSFSKLAGICVALWDRKRCEEISGGAGYGSPLGQALIIAMEDYYKMDRCESDNMEMNEQICTSCKKLQWAISPNRDIPKECGHCGAFDALWTPK
jgi:hypothetical protein